MANYDVSVHIKNELKFGGKVISAERDEPVNPEN